MSFSETIPEFLQRKGSVSDTEDACPKVPQPETASEAAFDQPAPERAEEQPVSDTPQDVQNMNPVPECPVSTTQAAAYLIVAEHTRL